MRFQKLQIPAFGPFQNLELRFRDQPPDFHVIYGANEAGKSSLLRAIRDLLFGIHAHSADNFLYDYADLRIRGELCNRAGEQLIFQRRKGNKNTLLDAEGKQLPDNALASFLGGVDLAYFSAMFGLGARELQEGAQQLLRGEGDLGTALFSASLGGTPVQKVVEALQQEAERLFKGRATVNVSLRPAATRYKELLKQSREAMVNPETWDTLAQELSKAEAEKKQLDEQLSSLQRDLGWIQRCEDALPTVSRLDEETKKLSALPTLPTLATDFIPRAKTARGDEAEARAEVQRLTRHIEQLRAQLAACQTNPAILAQAELLDQLHQDLGVYRNRKKSLADLQLKLAGLEPHLRAGMRNLQLTGEFATLESRRLSSAAQLACEEAATALQEALQQQSTNTQKAELVKEQISVKEADLLSLPETNLDALREALAVAAEATDADRTFAASEAEVQRLTRETAAQHRLMTGVPADFNTTAQLAVPALATIHHYRQQMENLKRELATKETEVSAHHQRSQAIQADLARLQRQGELPSEEALRKAREHRDHGWALVLTAWKGGGAREELLPGSPLEVAFPQAIVRADELADQLRLQAEAVAQAEEKRLQLSETEKELNSAGQTILKLQGDLQQCQTSWQTEWSGCGLTPRSPLEMEEWRDQWNQFRDRLGKLRTAEETLQKKREQVTRAKQRLASVLAQPEGKEFSILYAAARKLVQDGEQSAGRRLEMARQLAELKRELARLEQSRARLDSAVASAAEKWKAQCATVGLPEGATPASGQMLLRERKELLARFDEWLELSSTSTATAQAIARYEKLVGDKAAALGLNGETTEVLEAALWKALTQARQSQIRHDQLAEQVEQAINELEQAQGLLSQSEQALRELLHLAGLTTAEELEPLLAHLEQRQAIRGQIDMLRNTLSGLARGQSVDEFVSQVRAEDPDALAQRKAQAQRDQAEKEAVLATNRETLFRLRTEKSALEKAGDAAANFRQQAESCAATLKQDAARYLRLRLATHLLQGQIERFRKENQGPLLQKSGEVFRSITRGAFSGLGADFNADDLPVLVGIRADETKVPVEGMSDGSRDQLYLALRLAALDRYLEEHEPMPLILDDLLITCDNGRAQAVLPQLLELSRRTQIFLFTHHEHLVDLCRQTLGEAQFQLHHLTRGPSV